jgi:hypothetical protein
MRNMESLLKGGLLLALMVYSSGCVVAEPREGYYDHSHARYYHEHTWHECGERNDSCH